MLHKNYEDVYDGATTTVRSAAGLTEEFKVDIGLHQGLALSFIPFFHHYGQADGEDQEGRTMGYAVCR